MSNCWVSLTWWGNCQYVIRHLLLLRCSGPQMQPSPSAVAHWTLDLRQGHYSNTANYFSHSLANVLVLYVLSDCVSVYAAMTLSKYVNYDDALLLWWADHNTTASDTDRPSLRGMVAAPCLQRPSCRLSVSQPGCWRYSTGHLYNTYNNANSTQTVQL